MENINFYSKVDIKTGNFENSSKNVFTAENTTDFFKGKLEGESVVYTTHEQNDKDFYSEINLMSGVIMPGKVDEEFYMTKGHINDHEEAPEIYVCLEGEGLILVKDIKSGVEQVIPFEKGSLVRLTGGKAHRIINLDKKQLVYAGLFPRNPDYTYNNIEENIFDSRIVKDIFRGYKSVKK